MATREVLAGRMREGFKKVSIGFCCLLCLLAPYWKAGKGFSEAIDFKGLEADLLRELNSVRSSPQTYASHLREMKPFYHGRELRRPGERVILTQEGISALTEAIRFLERLFPVPTLRLSKGLSLGARDHVEAQAKTGAVGNGSSEGERPHERVSLYGSWERKVGENIVYGCRGGREAILTLLIDDGVPSRNHRKIIVDRDFRAVGIACGPHPVYETLCVLIFAGEYREKREGP